MHCLTNSWVFDLLRFCEEEDITIQDTCPNLALHTTNDEYLMQAFLDEGYQDTELAALNRCPLYLWAVTLSDISTADEGSITYNAYHGKYQTPLRSLGWPRRPPSLPLANWLLWRRALDKCFIRPHSTTRLLKNHLGAWLPDILPLWKWYFSASETRLYHTEGPGALIALPMLAFTPLTVLLPPCPGMPHLLQFPTLPKTHFK